MRNRGLIATIVVMAAVIISLIVVILVMKMPTIMSLDGIRETIHLIDQSSDKAETFESIIETPEVEQRIHSTTETYLGYKDKVKINYPVISGMRDQEKEENINNKIKMNALSIVPLYPISTALQTLDINYEIKKLDENVITIVYTGRVLGTGASSGSSSSSGSGSAKSSGGKDPYLDGFVDPLATGGVNNISIPQQTISSYTPPQPINENDVTVIRSAETKAATANTRNQMEHQSTADKGPVVVDIKAPTAPAGITSKAYENAASNNPSQSSSAVINPNEIVSSSTYYPPSVGNSNAPTSSANGSNLPVYSYSGTNTSASTIDQRIYFVNTIDLNTCLDLGLRDYITDYEALAKYIRSSKVEFLNIDEDDRSEVLTYIRKTVVSTLTDHLKKESDFKNEGVTTWPKHFSYKDDDGNIIVSVKLSSKLGNYAIIKYNK